MSLNLLPNICEIAARLATNPLPDRGMAIHRKFVSLENGTTIEIYTRQGFGGDKGFKYRRETNSRFLFLIPVLDEAVQIAKYSDGTFEDLFETAPKCWEYISRL